MKAIRIHGSKDARLEEVPTPEPKPDEVLVRVRAVAICAIDIELFDGVMFYITSGMTKYPFIPGQEWSGEVVATGDEAGEFQPGDTVVGECSIGCRRCRWCLKGWYHLCPDRAETGLLKQPGAFAEYIAFPKYFLHKCNELAHEQAAFIEPTGVAVNAVRRAGVCPEDCVIVMGAGPIGLFALQAAKAYGARKVILVDRVEERLGVGQELGADITVNVDRENLAEKIQPATDGHMIDAVIEAVGRKEVWPAIASILAPRARVAMTGLFAGAKCEVDCDPLVVGEVSILGCLGGPNLWPEAIALHASGRVRSAPIITHRLPLADFARAIEISRNRIEGAIKVLVEP
jgi:L-iditol 2-dehydrogenase